jgi:hypothetical protein
MTLDTYTELIHQIQILIWKCANIYLEWFNLEKFKIHYENGIGAPLRAFRKDGNILIQMAYNPLLMSMEKDHRRELYI